MKKTKLTAIVGLLAGATLVYFNVRHALNDYGIRDNAKLHPEVMAQAGTTNGGTTGNGGTTNNGGTTSGTVTGTTSAGGSSTDGGAYLTCYCALMSDTNCAVNNHGSSVCAGGENIKCLEYNRNCN